MDTSALSDIAARLVKLTNEMETLRGLVSVDRQSEAEKLRDLKLHALAEFAAGAGHEINNPLAVISGQAQQLLKTEESHERARSLERIIGQSRRIHQLLQDLMLYARPPQPRRVPVSLNRIVQRATASLSELAVDRRIVLETFITDKRVKLKGDAALLETAVLCLVRNAIEAAPAGGWARASLEMTDSECAEVIIEDNGPGLNTSQREHLFDPFYSGKSAGRSAGLGLSKAWRIAQMHSGQIRLDNEPGQPTRFILSLPMAESTKIARKSRRLTARNGHLNGKHIARKNGVLNGRHRARRKS